MVSNLNNILLVQKVSFGDKTEEVSFGDKTKDLFHGQYRAGERKLIKY